MQFDSGPITVLSQRGFFILFFLLTNCVDDGSGIGAYVEHDRNGTRPRSVPVFFLPKFKEAIR